MCQCFHNISLECEGADNGEVVWRHRDIGQHSSQVFVRAVQPPIVNSKWMKEKEIKSLPKLLWTDNTSRTRRPDTEYTDNLPLIDPNCTSYYQSNQPRRSSSKGVNGYLRKFSQYSGEASLRTSIPVSIWEAVFKQLFIQSSLSSYG